MTDLYTDPKAPDLALNQVSLPADAAAERLRCHANEILNLSVDLVDEVDEVKVIDPFVDVVGWDGDDKIADDVLAALGSKSLKRCASTLAPFALSLELTANATLWDCSPAQAVKWIMWLCRVGKINRSTGKRDSTRPYSVAYFQAFVRDLLHVRSLKNKDDEDFGVVLREAANKAIRQYVERDDVNLPSKAKDAIRVEELAAIDQLLFSGVALHGLESELCAFVMGNAEGCSARRLEDVLVKNASLNVATQQLHLAAPSFGWDAAVTVPDYLVHQTLTQLGRDGDERLFGTAKTIAKRCKEAAADKTPLVVDRSTVNVLPAGHVKTLRAVAAVWHACAAQSRRNEINRLTIGRVWVVTPLPMGGAARTPLAEAIKAVGRIDLNERKIYDLAGDDITESWDGITSHWSATKTQADHRNTIYELGPGTGDIAKPAIVIAAWALYLDAKTNGLPADAHLYGWFKAGTATVTPVSSRNALLRDAVHRLFNLIGATPQRIGELGGHSCRKYMPTHLARSHVDYATLMQAMKEAGRTTTEVRHYLTSNEITAPRAMSVTNADRHQRLETRRIAAGVASGAAHTLVTVLTSQGWNAEVVKATLDPDQPEALRRTTAAAAIEAGMDSAVVNALLHLNGPGPIQV